MNATDVYQAVSETLEAMAFMDVCPAERAILPNLKKSFWASLEILKPEPPNVFGVVCDEELMDEFVESLFGGSDADPSEESRFDVLAEILNTVAGRLVRRVAPENAAFEIGLPKAGCGDLNLPDDAQVICFNVQEKYLYFYLKVLKREED